jgi:hypothetical protein
MSTKVSVTIMGGAVEVYEGPRMAVAIMDGWLVVTDNATPIAVYAEHRTVKAKIETIYPQ